MAASSPAIFSADKPVVIRKRAIALINRVILILYWVPSEFALRKRAEIVNDMLAASFRGLAIKSKADGIDCFATLAHDDEQRRKSADVFSNLFSLDGFSGSILGFLPMKRGGGGNRTREHSPIYRANFIAFADN